MSRAVNHGERIAYAVSSHELTKPSYPDTSLDGLRVKIPESFRAPDPRNPFVVVMEQGHDWLDKAEANGHDLTPEKMTRLAQYVTGTVLNDQGLINMRGLARDTITPPTFGKGAMK